MQGKYHLGYKGQNRQGLSYEIIRYAHNKDLDIKFNLEDRILKTTGLYLTSGLPLHPTFNKIKVNDTYKTKDGLIVTVIGVKETKDITIKWEDGLVTKTRKKELNSGSIDHPLKYELAAGTEFKTNNYGVVKVKHRYSATNILVVFEDGVEHTTVYSDLKSGQVRHPTSGLTVGYKFKTNSDWCGEVLKYNSHSSVIVKWQDGAESEETASAIKTGGVKPLMQPYVSGLGFFGYGRFTPKSYKTGEHAPDRCHMVWTGMIQRCYNPCEQDKLATYRDVHVCKDWHNFQNFAEWYLLQENCHIEGIELDKDLLSDGFLYSPETCTLLPQHLNTFLAETSESQAGLLPGVNYIKPASANAKEGYIARCHIDGVRVYLGYYETPEQAFSVYKKAKEEYAKVLAERFKTHITKQAYEKLLTYEVNPVRKPSINQT